MKILFQKAKLSRKNMARLTRVNEIIENYAQQGYKLTLRQLYYRLVTENVIANAVAEYDRLSHLLTQGRMGGLVDWDAIEDRIRVPNLPYYNLNVEDAVKDAHERFRLDRMLGQENYLELWVEKDAISSIMKRSTHHYGIRLMVNRGYSSTTAMYDAFNRIQAAIERGQKAHILYLGDHDPSGRGMVEDDIPKRLNESFGTEVDITSIAITWEQIQELTPPPNPVKVKDPRSAWYREKYGDECYEVDALEPAQLFDIVNGNIESRVDMDMFNERLEEEARQKEAVGKLPKTRLQHAAISQALDQRIKLLSKKDLPKKTKEMNKGELATLKALQGILST